MAELPSHSDTLCFNEYINELQDKEFKLDQFISKCRKKVTVECLRKDLDAYYRTLKSAMVELINKDYADFVNLSANLVGMDKSIGDLVTPLCQLEGEIAIIKLSIEAAIEAVDGKLAERTQIRKEKDILQRLIGILESIEKLERLLKVKRHSTTVSKDGTLDEIEQLTKKSEFAAMVMERVACEFNKLQYNVKLTDHPLVEDSKPRIAVITSTLQNNLEESFQRGLDSKDRSIVTQCLQTYASINRCRSVEMLFGKQVVFPSLDKMITTKALLAHPQGLAGLYGDVLAHISEKCSLLLVITQETSHGAAVVRGYDFLVNSVWPQLVSLLEVKVSVIFAQGNPEAFHKNYMTSIQFVTDFEKLCGNCSSVKALRTHPSFNTFMNKWSLPVYFQIRYQEIAGTLESCLALPLTHCSQESHASKPHPLYKLEVFNILEECIKKCWKDDIFVQSLVHRFWKLTLQLLVRVSVWLQELTVLPLSETQVASKKGLVHSSPSCNEDKGLKLDDLLNVIHDSELLAKTVLEIYADVMKKKLVVYHPKESLLLKSLSEACSTILILVPNFSKLIIDGIATLCEQELESVNILPRLYRRTNKEIPSRASAYVSSTLQPLRCKIKDFPSHYKLEWMDQVITKLTKRYFEVGGELLTSVQRTEESLLKLKSYRKSLVPTLSLVGGGMTDDNKIRLQLALDIEEFTMQVLSLHPSAINIANFTQLLEQGQMAKRTAALATPST